MTDPDLRETERGLRRALEREASSVRPGDRLGGVLDRAHEEERERGPVHRWLVPLAAAALVAVVAGVFFGDRGLPGTAPAGSPTGSVASPTASGPTAPGSGSGSGSAGPSGTSGPSASTAAPTTVVPAYFVGPVVGVGDRQGLYREFVTTSTGGTDGTGPAARVAAAVRAALDPGARPGADYLAGWGGTTLQKATVSPDDRIVLTLSDGGPTGLDRRSAHLSVQQLVWTAEAALGRGPVPVGFVLADGGSDLFGRIPAGGVHTRPPKASWNDVLAPIWVSSPGRGQRLAAGSPVRLEGQASVFEGTLRWSLVRAGVAVDEGTVTASEGAPGRGTYRAQLGELPAGDYTLRVWETSQQDGSEIGTVEVPFSVG